MCRVKTKQGLKRKFERFIMKSLKLLIFPDSNNSNFSNLSGQGVKSPFSYFEILHNIYYRT